MLSVVLPLLMRRLSGWSSEPLGPWHVRMPASLSKPLLAPAAEAPTDEALLNMARDSFLRLQDAWDLAEVDTLRELTTASMFDELLAQLPQRGAGPNRTEVLALEVHLLAHEQLGSLELASIEYSGLMCESAEHGTVPFRELWMLTRCHAGEAWRLARQQTLF